jgi:hypothetical protein
MFTTYALEQRAALSFRVTELDVAERKKWVDHIGRLLGFWTNKTTEMVDGMNLVLREQQMEVASKAVRIRDGLPHVLLSSHIIIYPK